MRAFDWFELANIPLSSTIPPDIDVDVILYSTPPPLAECVTHCPLEIVAFLIRANSYIIPFPVPTMCICAGITIPSVRPLANCILTTGAQPVATDTDAIAAVRVAAHCFVISS